MALFSGPSLSGSLVKTQDPEGLPHGNGSVVASQVHDLIVSCICTAHPQKPAVHAPFLSVDSK